MKIRKNIPNALTCGNLVCGCLGILFTASLRLDLAFYAIAIAAILDFFDGFVARLLKVTSPIGKDLDSLADMVTFGVLPGFIMYQMIAIVLLRFETELVINTYTLFRIGEPALGDFERLKLTTFDLILPFIAFTIPVFSAIRLAKFNNDSRQTNSFIGVPTPANALLIGSLGLLLIMEVRHEAEVENNYYLFFNLYTLTILTIVMSYLLIAEIPLFALKFKKFGWHANRIRYTFLISSLALLILFQFTAVPFIIFLYVFLSIISNVRHRIKTRNDN
jgi:CDP-diacylglycerol--serine O-phosphatidyltransferase